MVVYLATNRITGKRYVGKTIKPIAKRWQHHVHKAYAGDSTHLHNSIRKYGPEAFHIAVLSVGLNENVLDVLERFWIRELKTKTPMGYNLTDGGDGQSGYRHTDTTREKISASLRGKPGRHAGHTHTAETRKYIGDIQRGRKQTPESIEKRVLARRGYTHSAETRAAIGAGNRGRAHSAQARLNMSLAAKRRYAREALGA